MLVFLGRITEAAPLVCPREEHGVGGLLHPIPGSFLSIILVQSDGWGTCILTL